MVKHNRQYASAMETTSVKVFYCIVISLRHLRVHLKALGNDMFKSILILESYGSCGPDTQFVQIENCKMLQISLLLLSRAQLSALKKWQIGPRTVGPRGSVVRGPTVRPEKVANWAPGPNCPGPNCSGRGPTLQGPICLEPSRGIWHQVLCLFQIIYMILFPKVFLPLRPHNIETIPTTYTLNYCCLRNFQTSRNC